MAHNGRDKKIVYKAANHSTTYQKAGSMLKCFLYSLELCCLLGNKPAGTLLF